MKQSMEMSQITQALVALDATKMDYRSPVEDLHVQTTEAHHVIGNGHPLQSWPTSFQARVAMGELSEGRNVPEGTDYTGAFAQELKLEVREGRSTQMMVGDRLSFNIGTMGHRTLREWLQIPTAMDFYSRLQALGGDLFDGVVNGLMAKVVATSTKRPSRLVRTANGQVRAVLSPSYRILDNTDLMNTLLPKVMEHNLEIVSGHLDESRLYLKAVTDKLTGEVLKGDVVRGGIIVSNSEVGAWSVPTE